MNEGLDTTLVLPELGEKPSIQYRTSPYTVREYCALPYAQRRAVDAACDEAAGLTYTQHSDESSPQPYTIGRATRPAAKVAQQAQLKSAPQAPFPQLNPSVENPREASGKVPREDFALEKIPTTISPMTTIHPAPSPPLHTLNTPEAIHHDERHPDNLATYARPEVVQQDGQLPEEQSHADWALTPGAMADALGEAARPEVVDSSRLLPTTPLPADGLVYETTDYDRFHLLPENRVIDFRHLRKLVGLIKQKNLLHLKPLDVTPEGGIIDGQHRWAAARELGLPFFYRVGEQLSEADITTLNIAQKNWTGTDYLHFWTVKGVPAYVTLTAFRERHPSISFSNAKMMLSDPKADLRLDEFNGGRWVATDEAAAEQVARLMERIADEVGFQKTSHTRFVAALYRAVKVKGFDADHFLRKLNMQPRALRQQATDRQYLEMFQELYNYKTMKENHIRLVGW